MPFNWIEYLDLAKALLQTNSALPASEEARYRASISRAYYAAFHKASEFLAQKEYHRIPKTGKAHEYVPEQFALSDEKARKQIAIHLDRLKVKRTKADYRDVFTNLPAEAQDAIYLAEQIINLLQNLT